MGPGTDAAGLSLSDAEYRLFRDFFRQSCGLWFDEDSRFLLEKRLARRVRALDLGSFSAYLYLLRRDPAGDHELSAVIDELTTNETYFFREHGQLRALVEEVMPAVLESRRAVSAPSSASGPRAARAARSPTPW